MNIIFQWILSALALLWMIFLPGLGLAAMVQRNSRGSAHRWHLVFLGGIAICPPILYITQRYTGFTGLGSLLVSTILGASLLLLARVSGRKQYCPSLPGNKTIAAVVLLVSLSIAAAYVEFPGGHDIYANTVSDWNNRQAAVWSVRHFGLPLQNTLFYPGRSVPLYYPAGPYLLPAAAAMIGGNSVPEAWPFAIFAVGSFASLCMLVRNLAGRMFASPAAGNWAAVLILCGGLDVLVNAALWAGGSRLSLGHVSAWADAAGLRIDSLYCGALWAAPHFAPAAALFLLLQILPLSMKRPTQLVAGSLLTAGIFYLSPFVAVAAGAVLAAWMLLQIRRDRWKRWLRRAAALAVCGLVAALIALPWLADLWAAKAGASHGDLAWGFPPASIHPVSRFLGSAFAPADLLIQALVGLLPLGALGLAGWQCCRAKLRFRPLAQALGAAMIVLFVLVLSIRSMGLYNDWALRASHVIQISAAVLGGGYLARLHEKRRWIRVTIYASMTIGLLGTAWEMSAETLGRYVSQTPPHRWELYQASEFIRTHTPDEAVVLIDPGIEGIHYATRWSGRRSMLTPFTSSTYDTTGDLARVRAICQDIAHRGLCDQEQIIALKQMGISAAIVRTEKLSSQTPPLSASYRNNRYVVVVFPR